MQTTPRPGKEFELVVHVEGTDLNDIVTWLRQAADRIEQGEKEMNMEEETAAGSFFVEVFEPQEISAEETGDKAQDTSVPGMRWSDHDEVSS